MAERKPLVSLNGELNELPVGDSLPNSALPLKTVNGASLYGVGNVTVAGGSGGGIAFLPTDLGLITTTQSSSIDLGGLL